MRKVCGAVGERGFPGTGTLLDTAAVLVQQAPAGYWVAELEAVLHIPVKDALR